MSVDGSGFLVPRRVTGWHVSPLGPRRLFRMTYRGAKRAGPSRVAVQLTGDHEVLTQRGWKQVRDLGVGDQVATGQGLSDLAYDVVCGSLLGDASISTARSAVSMSHSRTQREYALFKGALLAELRPRYTSVAQVVGGVTHHPIQVRTLAHRALGILRREFYREQKRVPEWMASTLNPRMVAFWFMDDGHMRIRPPRQPSAEIAAVGFTDRDRAILIEGLRALGVAGRDIRGRIHFDVRETKKLSRLIAPFVPGSMRRKLHPEVALSVPFEPELCQPGPQRVLFDDVLVEEITGKASPGESFYCLDVEETHNFVTTGGVVHNCRPPGNRDPKPEEIDACKPWLAEQIDIIQPTVICTLGNFATRLLLGKQVGITRVRGQRFTFRGKTMIPTFHPAAILRGGRNSNAMAQIEDDFRQLAKALEELRDAEPGTDAEQMGLF